MLNSLYRYLYRNKTTLTGNKYQKNIVNYEYWNYGENLGDYLSYIVYKWMLERRNLSEDSLAKKTCHLMGIGSIIAEKNFDSVIWGSGIHTLAKQYKLYRWKNIVKYDVRAVRGPITKNLLLKSGYNCDNVKLGDPAVLMPFIYKSNSKAKKYLVSVINHFSLNSNPEIPGIHYIDIQTHDYEKFIDEILASEFIISSSLHGIILAESYGIPAVFLNEDGKMYSEIIKYFDWYLSTERNEIKIAKSIEEAINLGPMVLPELYKMQQGLIESFPYDLWISNT